MSPPLHRYWLFVGDVYYACGGIHDLHATYPTLDAARAAAAVWIADEDALYSWWHVIDALTGTIEAASAQQGYGVTWRPPAPS
jgi:hypothetical protein